MSQNLKAIAAAAAIPYLNNVTTLGVGTGSTVDEFINLIPQDFSGTMVSSSEVTTRALRKRGFAPEPLNSVGDLGIYIDGADYVDRFGNLLKGGGGAHTQEKIVAYASKKFVVIATDAKLVESFSPNYPVVIEVLTMARSLVARQLRDWGARPEYRMGATTDNGHDLLDVYGLDLSVPQQLEEQLNSLPGVVGHGLFAKRRADIVLIATGDGQIKTMECNKHD